MVNEYWYHFLLLFLFFLISDCDVLPDVYLLEIQELDSLCFEVVAFTTSLSSFHLAYVGANAFFFLLSMALKTSSSSLITLLYESFYIK